MMPLAAQVIWLFVLALPVACIAWAITHEELFREPREYCVSRSRTCRRLFERKFFFAVTCEFCLSHYIAAVFVAITGFQLLLKGWRGYLIGGFALVWIANFYMSLFVRLRLDIKSERLDIAREEKDLRKGTVNGNKEDHVKGAQEGRQGDAGTQGGLVKVGQRR
jgi:hypothetical protein